MRGIGLVTGDSGSGKTTTCRHLVAGLHSGLYRVLYVSMTTGNVMDLYKSIAWELGLPTERNRAALFRQIRSEVSRLCAENRLRPVLIVDEAHHLRTELLEDLRLLTNYAMDSENRLTVVLVGHPELTGVWSRSNGGRSPSRGEPRAPAPERDERLLRVRPGSGGDAASHRAVPRRQPTWCGWRRLVSWHAPLIRAAGHSLSGRELLAACRVVITFRGVRAWASADAGEGVAEESKRPFRKGWVHRDDKLLMFEDTRLLVLRGWPDVRAWTKHPDSGWRGTRPVDPLLSRIGTAAGPRFVQRAMYTAKAHRGTSDMDAVVLDRLRAGLTARSAAAWAFKETVPPAIWSTASAVPDRQWHLLALLARVPGADDIACDNLALAACMASCWVFRGEPVGDLCRTLRRKAVRRRTEIAEWLGFPARPAVVRVLSKVRPDTIVVPRLFYLRSALRAERISKALLHLPAIDRGVLRVVTDPALAPFAHHSLLEEMLADPGKSQDLAYVLRDTCQMAEQLGVRVGLLRSATELRATHDELTKPLNDQDTLGQRAVVFPGPPLPGTDEIVPITSAYDLGTEGRMMDHCVGTYIPIVERGQVYVYQVLAPERATLSLRLGRDGWALEQIKGPSNADVAGETATQVRAWLATQRRSGHLVAPHEESATEVHF
jgi:hypothetical protein